MSGSGSEPAPLAALEPEQFEGYDVSIYPHGSVRVRLPKAVSDFATYQGHAATFLSAFKSTTSFSRPGKITHEPIFVYFVSGGKCTKEIMTNQGGL